MNLSPQEGMLSIQGGRKSATPDHPTGQSSLGLFVFMCGWKKLPAYSAETKKQALQTFYFAPPITSAPLSIWCVTRTQNPTLLLRLQRLETKASEVHSLRAGKPRGLSRKLSLRGLVGGPPAEGKDLEWTAMVHSEARDSAWG